MINVLPYSKLRIASSLLVTMMFYSCAKDGAIGPAGAQEPSGSVDMITSPWINVTFTGSAPYYTGVINAPELTQGILDSGLVKVYFTGGSFVTELPNEEALNGLEILLYPGSIHIYAPIKWDASSGYKYRYVLVPSH